MVGSIIFCSIGVASCGIAFYLSRNTSKINLDVKLKNQKILEEQAELQKSKKELENQINLLDFEIKNKNDKIENINLSISIAQENQEKLQSYSNNAFLMYQENLENRYNEVEAEYDLMTDLIKSSF
jgi:chromosome segregation ATPase